MALTMEASAGGVIRPGATLSPRAIGMAGAHNAVANDGAAFYHNVAGLAQIEKNFVQLNADTIFPRFEFESQKSEFSAFLMPEIAAGFKLSDRLVLSGGIYAPYGLGVEYSNGPFQKSLLAVVNGTLALSYRLTDTLSLGIGGDIGYGQLVYESSLHQIGDVLVKPVFLKTKGKGIGFSVRGGLLWQPKDWFSFALSYSSAMDVRLDGRTNVRLFGLNLGTDKFDSEVSFPARWGTGIALRPAKDWLIAFDVNYYDHRKTDNINFDFKLLPTIQQKLRWDNNWSVHLGIEHRLNEHWTVRTGGAWMQAAVPKNTTNRIIPDGNGVCAGLGFGYRTDNWSVDVAYLHAIVKRGVERTSSHIDPGDYKVSVDVISVGFTYHF
jgi:long-chain fatty acid transport protein